MNLFPTALTPKLKQPDGFTPLKNGMSYNDLVDEEAETILAYNALLERLHQLENKPSEQSEGKMWSLLCQRFWILKNGLAYGEQRKTIDKLTANFNLLMAENYELVKENEHLNNEKK
ncbi:hypothetical protein GHI93_00275 [Lactococcus hircilactis]|uniref:Uncharacterized protein n=1 Tax=Lactococcus hircilactis TaxID=1494462 RepID=A0A7X1Z7Z4_9LACT|nr:hypothetical protein [Lactococcus hircilactis]MQW38386.1 hypothetical protein [Lactococcus hircilactis]